ncbi:AbrB/MazE/SpoVT family DNA-binding domain-containing protein [Peribacillus muralis]|uniref:AbrB/MazE/SpoVT family DNA-binding domain-containing protein n=1 Tax=Peribacillus muralis TaxID=264697 RepID=UPI003CFEFB1F
MKPTGIVRKIDCLGRLNIPIEIRRSLGWEQGEEIEFLIDGKYVALQSNDQEQKTMEALDTLEEAEEHIQDPELKQKIKEVIRYLVTKK